MNFIKRALLSSKARFTKTIIILTIMTTICIVILASLGIKSASEKSSILARQKLGGAVTLTLDVQKVRENSMNTSVGGQRVKITEMPITLDYLDEIKSIEHIESYLLSTVSNGISNDILAVGKEEGIESTVSRGPVRGDFTLSGVNSMNLSSEYKAGDIELLEGREINESDNGNVAVIEETLASDNGLKVGGKFIIEDSLSEGKTLELDIVGIYRNSSEFTQEAFNNIASSPYNNIFIPYNIASSFKGEEYENAVDKMIFYLDDPVNVEGFIKEAEETSIDFNTFMLDADTREYEMMMGPIENVASFSNTALIVVTIFGTVILALIIMLSIRERKNEIGILLSLGEGKGKIIGQFLVEILLVLVMSLTIAGIMGGSISNIIGDKLLSNELQVVEEVDTSFAGGPGGGRPGQTNLEDVEKIDELNIEISGGEFASMAALAGIVALISTIIPVASVMRLHPKTILSNDN